MRLVRRFWLPAVLLALVAVIWASALSQDIGWDGLARYQQTIRGWIAAHPILAPGLYILAYAFAAAASVPEAAFITVAGGLLFGAWLGGTLAVIGSTLGATVLFLAIRHHLADAVAARGGRLLDRLRAELHRDSFLYLLAIRLIPAFPFWLVNIAAGLSGMRLLPYASATVIGVMPATFIFAWIGAGVADVLAMGGEPNLSVLYTPRILGPLVGLAALSLLPVVWRRFRPHA